MRFTRMPKSAGKIENGATLKVLLALCSHLGRDDYAFPSLDTIQDETRLSKRSVFRAIVDLEELGIVARVSSGRYFVFFDSDMGGTESDDMDGTKVPPVSSQSDMGGTPILITNKTNKRDSAHEMKFTGIRLEADDEDRPKRPTKTGLSTGVAAKAEIQKAKRTAFSQDALAMVERLEKLTSRATGRGGADRDRWNSLAKDFPGPKGLELVEAAYRDRAKMERGDWGEMALNSIKVRWYADNMFKAGGSKNGRSTLAEYMAKNAAK